MPQRHMWMHLSCHVQTIAMDYCLVYLTNSSIDFKPSCTRMHGWSVVAVDTDILCLFFATNCTGNAVASESHSTFVSWCTWLFMIRRRVTSNFFAFSLRRIREDCHFVLQLMVNMLFQRHRHLHEIELSQSPDAKHGTNCTTRFWTAFKQFNECLFCIWSLHAGLYSLLNNK